MRTRFMVIAAIAALVALSFVRAPYPEELVLQHVPTVAGLVALAFVTRYGSPSRVSFVCVVTFLLLHIVGARWIYSYVPYEAWIHALTGSTLAETFGWRRNGYDRLVHLASGLCGVPPAAEYLQRLGGMGRIGATLMAVATVLAIGAIYEIIEWQIAILFSPARAEAYNGQQGDIWDPQKDLACAWIGAMLAACWTIRQDFRSSRR